jgi:hypothetical protein
MRPGITFDVTAADRVQLEAVVANRGPPQKHVWRAKIILMSDDGLGTVDRQIEDLRLALAGTFHGRRRGRPSTSFRHHVHG